MSNAIPFAKAIDGTIVTVDRVLRGLACDCVCIECNNPLVAAKGEIKRHYFRHHLERRCGGSPETALHLFAKQILHQATGIGFFEVALGLKLSSEIEATIEGNIRPDVLMNFELEPVAVEIWCAHKVPIDKVKRYALMKHAALEIDLRAWRFSHHTDEEWEKIILDDAPRAWLFPPKPIWEENERRRLEELERFRQAAQKAYELEMEAAKLRAVEEERLAALMQQQAVEQEMRKQELVIQRAKSEEYWKRKRKEEAEARIKSHEEKARNAEIRIALKRFWEAQLAMPDLQAMMLAHGTWADIPPEAWAKYDHEMDRFYNATREGWKYDQFMRQWLDS